MNAQLLRQYLSWQSEIGCDEVILPNPLVRKEKKSEGVNAALPHRANLTQQPAFQHADAFRPTSASNVFGDMARAFQSPEIPVKPKASANPPIKLAVPPLAQSAPSRMAEVIAYPSFTEAKDFWDYLSKHSKAIFTSDKELTLLPGMGPINAPLSLVGMQPTEADGQAKNLFSGETGVLLEKMLRAIHLDCNLLYRTTVLKHYSGTRIWSRREIGKILPLLHTELSLYQAPVVLLLGEACAQAVLKTTKTMEELRQIPHREGNREFVVTYHPDELLRREEWKRPAWLDLQWLERRLNQRQGQ